MEAIILTKEQFENLQKDIHEIKAVLTEKQEPKDKFVDNVDFMQMMKISKRTAQTWRDEGKISFSQIGSKIYYRVSDVEELLSKNNIPAFKKK